MKIELYTFYGMTLESKERLAQLLQEMKGNRSERAFARDLKVHPGTLGGWLRCETFPDQANLEQLARLRQMSLDAFLSFLRGDAVLTDPKTAEDLFALTNHLSDQEAFRLARLLLDRVGTDLFPCGRS